MKIELSLNIILILTIGLSSCKSDSGQIEIYSKRNKSIGQALIIKSNLLINRIQPPIGYTRQKVEKNSFSEYLRNLKLKPKGSLVKYFNGETKYNHGVYHSVVDMKIGDKDLHQCADAIMRMRAEYFWDQKQYDKIHFNFTNGFRVGYTPWMNGQRILVKGNKTKWDDRIAPSNTYEDFWNYMELIFMYAGTSSLEKELIDVVEDDIGIGDVLIQGGHPGHAVIIVDKAVDDRGRPVFLLAQSYMPAQETQILINPVNELLSPWYGLEEDIIETPEWNFHKTDIKRFR